ncbi:putative cation efflux family protein [Rhizodiscina lignyota]|uniref:Cation efflux family protein n=1 Tax=Rhizodiscina lignyota TaxID=1504668 RepID=A0A9P4I748_9PEZI|nr:putative cation efflux family protein [Rhizodiscina lignyota]
MDPASLGPPLTRTHSSHSHHSHHSHQDNVYLTSTNKNDAGVRITRIGLYVNLGMAVGKGVGGYVFHSQALLADAVHSLTDLVSDFMTLATISWALKPPTPKFPFGYGKVESLGSLGVSSILLLGGVLMGWSAIMDLCRIYLPVAAEAMESLGIFGHSHGHSHHIPGMGAAWLAGASILIKEWLYRATLKVAKERKSSVLESNAVHHRVDSMTSIAAMVSIGISNIFPAFHGADSIGGLLITWLVVRTGWGNTRAALNELADAGMDDEVKAKVHGAASKALIAASADHHVQVGSIQGVKAGQTYLMEIELKVPAQWTVSELQPVEQAVRERIGAKVRGARRVRIRFVPGDAEPEFMNEFISPSVSARSSPEPEEEHEHNHAHDHGDSSSKANGNGTAVKRR